MPCFLVVHIICTTRVKDQTWQFHNAIWELKSPKAIVSLKKHEQTGTNFVQDSTSPICYLAVRLLTSKSKKAERIAHPIRLVSLIHIRKGGYYFRELSQRYSGHGESDLQAQNRFFYFDLLGFVESLHHTGSANH